MLGYTTVVVLGTILHFIYGWTKGAIFVAPFSAVNESTWEHMKIFFFPALFFTIFHSFFFKDVDGFWLIKLKGTLLGMILIPLIFYTYNGAIGKSPDWFNIAIFFIASGLCFLYEGILIRNQKQYNKNLTKLSIMLFCIIGLAFVLFTFETPELAIFLDPIYQSYGIYNR